MAQPQPHSLRACFLAEVLGTFILVLFGCGAVHSAVLTDSLSGLWQVGVVWGLGVVMAIYAVGPISGSHINPAITVGLAVWGMFPWRKVPAYVGAQLLGAFVAAAVLFAIYRPFLREVEDANKVVRGLPGSEITAMCYGEYFPNPTLLKSDEELLDTELHAKFLSRVPHWAAFLAEVVATAVLGLVVCAVANPANPLGPRNLAPAFIGLTVAALICIIGALTQACLNPARDFGPRLFAALAGWGSIAIPGPHGVSFLTVYILAPLLGGIAGIGLYERWIAPTIARNRELSELEPNRTIDEPSRGETLAPDAVG